MNPADQLTIDIMQMALAGVMKLTPVAHFLAIVFWLPRLYSTFLGWGVKGSLDLRDLAAPCLLLGGTLIVVSAYPSIAWHTVHWLQYLGYYATGNGVDPMTAGEIAQRGKSITESIQATILSLSSWRPDVLMQNMGLILQLTFLGMVIAAAYIVLALRNLWTVCEFALGYVKGQPLMAGLVWGRTAFMTAKSTAYTLGSGLTFMALAIIQGFAEKYMSGITLPTDGTATIPGLEEAMWYLLVLLVMALVAGRMMQAFLNGAAGAAMEEAAKMVNTASRIGQKGITSLPYKGTAAGGMMGARALSYPLRSQAAGANMVNSMKLISPPASPQQAGSSFVSGPGQQPWKWSTVLKP